MNSQKGFDVKEFIGDIKNGLKELVHSIGKFVKQN